MFAIKGTKLLEKQGWFNSHKRIESWWTGLNFGAGHFKKKFNAKDQAERSIDDCLSWMHPPMNGPYDCNWDDNDDPFFGEPRSIYTLEVVELEEEHAMV